MHIEHTANTTSRQLALSILETFQEVVENDPTLTDDPVGRCPSCGTQDCQSTSMSIYLMYLLGARIIEPTNGLMVQEVVNKVFKLLASDYTSAKFKKVELLSDEARILPALHSYAKEMGHIATKIAQSKGETLATLRHACGDILKKKLGIRGRIALFLGFGMTTERMLDRFFPTQEMLFEMMHQEFEGVAHIEEVQGDI